MDELKINLWFPTLVGEANFAEARRFNPLLAQSIRDLARRERGEAARTTVNHGWQSKPDFLDTGCPEVQALRGFFNHSLETYLSQWGRIYNNAMAPPAFTYRYQGWAVLLESGGYQHQHVHSRTDFVGVYCVEAPRLDPGSEEGSLTLLDPRSGRLANRAIWEREREAVRPQPGRLVLFPSFVPHRVDAFHGPGERITINFDVTLHAAG
ncbi:MAG TPA: putative 2OG-Fe(II) oxygenase [Thermoanaerobaculia bacterium]|jgi:uncharacterized protein (TIGR02466 family)